MGCCDYVFKNFKLFLLFSLIFSSQLQGERIAVGKGGYQTTQPEGTIGPSDRSGNPAVPYVTANFKKPVTTNEWWSSLIWKYNPANKWSLNLFALPFSAKASAAGLALGYSNQANVTPYHTEQKGHKSHGFYYNFTSDLVVGVNGMSSPDTRVEDYSDWAVTAFWQNNGRQLKATLGHGLPFVYFTKSGDNIVITCPAAPRIWYNQNGVLGVTVNNHHYGIFGPVGSTWTTGQKLVSSLNGKDFLSIAVLPTDCAHTIEFYRQHAYAFVTSTRVDWNFNETTSVLEATYRVETTLREQGAGLVNRPLLALYPHHWLNTNAETTGYTYASPRGLLKVIDANEFTTTQTFHGILPTLPHLAKDGEATFSRQRLYDLVDSIYKQDTKTRWNGLDASNTDTYWEGKAMNKITQLLYVADQIQHTAAKQLFLTELKNRLQWWLDGNPGRLFYYDSTWKTLIGYPASFGSDKNLSDHHYHYGLFIEAAAAVALFDPAWIQDSEYGGMIKMLIKDVSNWDRADERFGFLRNFDIYEGHSWANGPAYFATGNNQESSSESMNYSGSVALLGLLTGNKTLRDLGIFLYATETAAIQQYWFDVLNKNFPANYPEPVVGIVWGNGGAYDIWWNGTIEELHGINFLPVTGSSLYLAQTPEYLRLNQAFMAANPTYKGDRADTHLKVKALYDSSTAIAEFNSNPGFWVEPGESKAHVYYWIHNMHQLGLLNLSVTSNWQTAAVFEKNGKRRYVAFNPASSTQEVTFSNGVHFTVPAKSYAVKEELSIQLVDIK